MEELNVKFQKNIWLKIIKEFFAFKKLLFFAMLCVSFAGAMEICFSLITKYAIDVFITKKDMNTFFYLCAASVIFIILYGAVIFVYTKLAGTVEVKMCYNLRKKCFEKYQDLSLSFYDKNAVGWLMARMSSDINKLSSIIAWGATEFMWSVFILSASLITMFFLNIKLTLIAAVMLPMFFILSYYIYGKILHSQRKVRKLNSELTAAYNEDIQGAQTTKTLVREELNANDFLQKTEHIRSASIRAICISAILAPLIGIIGSADFLFISLLGGNDAVNGSLTVGSLVAFFTLTAYLSQPVIEIAAIFSEFISAQAAAERIINLLEEEPEIKNTLESEEKYKLYLNSIISKEKTDCPSMQIKGNVKFENVSFSYNNDEVILDNFNLSVKAGETVALVGATGAGKSTIVNLLCRFYEPVSGNIYIDGENYLNLPLQLIHNSLGYVLQQPHLFSGTVMENIRYGNLEASDEQIIEAAKLVNAHEFISGLPHGYKTYLGENGAKLSTGQKQLVSFARILVRNPSLFVLDEATSSIDTETEQIIQRAIEKTLEGRTSFVIAHRLSTIRSAEKIIVMEKGKIKEMGNHLELLKKKGAYYEFYKQQFIRDVQL